MKITIKALVAGVALLATVPAAMGQASAADVLKELKNNIAPDKRTAVWNVNTIDQNGVLTVWGTVGTQEQKDAVSKALNGTGTFQNQLVVLENSLPADKRWAVVKLSIATLRTSGKHAAEMATQAIMGTPVKVIQADDDWYRVQTPDDYIAYVPSSSLRFMTAQELQAWKQARRCIVTVYDTRLVTKPGGDETVSDLVLGNVLEYKGEKGKWVLLATPDGRQGYVEKASVQDFAEWSKQDFNVEQIEKTAFRMMGSSYLWGGTSTKVTDCSGLSKVSYFSNGIILQRDASQQALYGLKIKGSDWQQCQPGDLLFFGNSTTGRVTHVGIYLHDGKYIHCSGQVKVNSLVDGADDYLYPALSASRVAGQVGTKGITAVRNHPWYF